MTHKLHLGTADSSRNKGLALAANDHEESETDEEETTMLARKFKKFFRNNRYGNQRHNKERGTANMKTNFECHKCGNTDHFIKDCPQWKNDKGKVMQMWLHQVKIAKGTAHGTQGCIRTSGNSSWFQNNTAAN